MWGNLLKFMSMYGESFVFLLVTRLGSVVVVLVGLISWCRFSMCVQCLSSLRVWVLLIESEVVLVVGS